MEYKVRAHRDEATGEVIINGKMGAIHAWAKFLQPIIVSVTGGAMLALVVTLGAYLVGHRDAHIRQGYVNEDFVSFMGAGDRFSSSEEYPSIKNVAGLIDHIESNDIDDNSNVSVLANRIDSLEKRLGVIEADVKTLLRRGG